MSAKMRISPLSWVVSTETDPRVGGASPPGTCPWYSTSWQRLPETLKRGLPETLDFQNCFLVPPGFKHRGEIHAWLHKNIRHQSYWSKVFVPLTQLKRVQPWPPLYIRLKPVMSGPLLLIGPSSWESPWSKFCQPATGSHITPSHSFYPTALKGCRGIVFTHGVRMGGRACGWAGGQREIVCPGCISETVRCRKLILGRDIG